MFLDKSYCFYLGKEDIWRQGGYEIKSTGEKFNLGKKEGLSKKKNPTLNNLKIFVLSILVLELKVESWVVKF